MSAISVAYDRYCTSRFPLPSAEAIRHLESRISVPLPDDYRQFLREFNGGYFSEPRIRVPDEQCPAEFLEYMQGIGAPHPHAELATPGDLAIYDDNDPPLIPIGGTPAGSLILLVTDPDDCGTIALATLDGTYWLADGIEEFFALLAGE